MQFHRVQLNKMILAYYIGEADGNLYFYEDAPPEIFCSSCGSVIDKTYAPKVLQMSRKARSLDIFSSYDGKTLVSERGATFFRHAFAHSCRLTQVNAEVPTYLLEATQIVEFDTERRETRFIDHCSSCNSFEEVIGATPCFLKSDKPLTHGLYRTDIEFGSGRSKHPLLLVGAEDATLIKTFKPHGGSLYLKPIHS